MSSDVVLKSIGLGKRYEIYDRPSDRLLQTILPGSRKRFKEHWALRNISFEVKRGQMVGVIGRNGSGKSTLLQMVAGVLTPTEGKVVSSGRIAALLELGAGFHPEFSGRENVYLNAQILGMTRAEVAERFDRIADFADIGNAIEQPVKTYSSGMVVRLAFAVAAHVEPDILIVDEALAVGDLSFQARCLDRIRSLRDAGVSTLFVTHDLGTFQALCDYGYLLSEGTLRSEGSPDDLAAQYYQLSQEHETQRLRRSSSVPGSESGQQDVPTPTADAKGRFGNALDAVPQTRPEDPHTERRANQAETSSSHYRFGTHEARIVEYRLLNSAGQQCIALKTGEKFAIEMDIEVYRALEDLTGAVMFRNAQGQNLFGANTRYDGPVAVSPHAGSRWLMRMEMEMRLNPGEYLLHLGLAQCKSDHVYVTLDNRDKLDVVTVYGKPVSYGLIHHEPRFEILEVDANAVQHSTSA